MTQYSTSTNSVHPDWTNFIATAMFEGGQAFLKTISSASSTIDEAQLQADEKQADRRLAQAFDAAKRDRANPGPHLLSAVRNWSRKQALAILREKAAGKQIRQDFYQPFQYDLQQEISTMILDLQLFWEQEDERRAVAKRKEAEQAFDAAYPVVRGLNDAVLDGERERRAVFESGQQMARDWANKYEESVKTREQQIEEREKLIGQQERENREHQLALRSLARWDDRASFANTMVSTGKNTIGCLFLWLLLVAGILVAIYFAFPHH
ncbi:hypothetical protein [Dictyobacter aurantiacus]|uniref:Uncharacterized protein n=1 Tax=Dictyobacter aurantiacus TaxID=1936993 RepID=A0A401ZQK8_9CHLR|nr:hypothetical protein [Dictyobacter aurantiacus]GCE09198.1 hypothetical protein KDAU_65270 [Dictyobacter aurantiacus]